MSQEFKYKQGEILQAFAVSNAQDGSGRAFWAPIGLAFVNKDGSFNVKLHAVPVNGARLVIRKPKPKDEQKSKQQDELPMDDADLRDVIPPT